MQKIKTGHVFKDSLGYDNVVMDNLQCRNVRHTGSVGWNMQTHHLKLLMGLPPKLPADGTDIMQIGNVKVYLVPQHLARMEKPSRNRPHRLMACCPKCNYIIPAGRLQQHMKVHK